MCHSYNIVIKTYNATHKNNICVDDWKNIEEYGNVH